MNRKLARKLMAAIVDNEVSDVTAEAFHQFIRFHPDIRREYEEQLKIKSLLARQLPKYRAPERLRESILKKLDQME